MKLARVRCLSLALSASLVAVGSGTLARADAPQFQTVTVDRAYSAYVLSAACGFPITGHLTGTIRIADFTDASGTVTKEIKQYQLTNAFTANGLTITGMTTGPEIVTVNPDGSLTVVDAGLTRFTTLPGSGVVFGTAGRTVTRIAPDGTVTGVQQVGEARVDAAAICAALTA